MLPTLISVVFLNSNYNYLILQNVGARAILLKQSLGFRTSNGKGKTYIKGTKSEDRTWWDYVRAIGA